MMVNFKGQKTIIFAPLAGISDSPARLIAREFGSDIVISGLISAEGLIRGCRKTWELADFRNSERPVGLQLFGANPESMARAAADLARLAPDFIDINFGCPARKIVDKNGGSSVLRDLELLKNIVVGVVQAVDIPVTVKMRAGWDDSELIFLQAGEIVENAGAAAVTIHPRTKIQGFSGTADWSRIKELKARLSIPVIGNGDINSPEDAKRMFDETGCDSIMIGRAAVGNPWIFKQVKGYLENGQLLPKPEPHEKIELALRHFDMMVEYYGLPRAIFKMRSQLCWYLRGLPKSSEIKTAINKLLSPSQIKDLLYSYRDSFVDQAIGSELEIST
jgi:tRNA-dihydrouridine synthase B